MSENRRVLPPPGEVINVEDRKVHIQRNGSGAPTVVFEAGLVSDSFAFAKVQPEIAKITSTISYDRAGMGYSEPSSNLDRVREVLAKEFFDLLETLNISKPVVLVGWSAGGQYIRDFAFDHPERIAGLVLIDSSVENGLDFFPEELVHIIQQDRNNTTERFTQLSKMTRKEILTEFAKDPPWQNRHPSTHQYYKDRVRPEMFKYFLQIISSWIRENDQSEHSFRPLGDIPLTVIYAVEENSPQFNQDQSNQLDNIWDEIQGELAGLSTHGRLIRVVSGHDIANEKPDIVIEAIKDIVKQARSS